MFKLDHDDKNNRIIITIEDVFDSSAAEQLYNDLMQIAPKLKKGFVVITDMTSLKNMKISSRYYVGKVMDLFNSSGVSKVIRVIPSAYMDFGLNILSMFHYSTSVPIHVCRTMEEASKYL